MSGPYHVPVLLSETLRLLDCRPGDTVVDATVGGAGHSSEIVRQIQPDGLLVGIDRDVNALKESAARLGQITDRVVLIHGDFRHLARLLQERGIGPVDRVLFDFGVSSHQLDTDERGFSYWAEGAILDMRMDTTRERTAYDIVNTYSETELTEILRDYGEERFAQRIAQFICRAREASPIRTTDQLVGVIKAAIPARFRREGGHPARRTFQALRIAVNDELGSIKEGLSSAMSVLRSGGVIAAISFHSLEDRIVKQMFREWATGCTCPPEIPQCICHRKPIAEILTRRPVSASPKEMEDNPRARSAKLRAVRKF